MREDTQGPSEVVMTELVLPSHTNSLGTIFGGVIMSWIDIAGAIAAQRHARQTVVTAGIDDLDFVYGAKVGWIVHIKAKVNLTSRSSMEIGVRVESENPFSGEVHHTASAYLTFVAIDKAGKPVSIPQLTPKTPEEKRRHEDAEKRRDQRLARRKRKTKA